jgi:hypothetical protein
MNKSYGYLKKIGYLVDVFIIIAFWGCGGGGSSNGSGDILGSDAIGNSQVATDSSVQDIERDTEYQDIEDIKDIIDSGDIGEDIEADVEVGYDIADISGDVSDTESSGVIEDISDLGISDAIENITDDIKDVVEDIQDVSDSGLDVSDISDCGKTDSRHLWSKRFGGNGDDEGSSVSVDSSGNVYGTGFFQSSNVDFGGCPLSSAGSYDIYLIKYAP